MDRRVPLAELEREPREPEPRADACAADRDRGLERSPRRLQSADGREPHRGIAKRARVVRAELDRSRERSFGLARAPEPDERAPQVDPRVERSIVSLDRGLVEGDGLFELAAAMPRDRLQELGGRRRTRRIPSRRSLRPTCLGAQRSSCGQAVLRARRCHERSLRRDGFCESRLARASSLRESPLDRAAKLANALATTRTATRAWLELVPEATTPGELVERALRDLRACGFDRVSQVCEHGHLDCGTPCSRVNIAHVEAARAVREGRLVVAPPLIVLPLHRGRGGFAVEDAELTTDDELVDVLGTWSRVASLVWRAAESAARQRGPGQEVTSPDRGLDYLFEHAPVGLALMGPEGEFVRTNRRLSELLGYTKAELESRSYQDITPADFSASDATLHQKLAAGEIDRTVIVKQLTTKAGATVWHRVTVSRLPVPDDRVHFIAVTEDVTAEHWAAQAVTESEERLWLLVEHAPAAIAIFDREMRFLAASRRFAADFDADSEDLLGRNHYEVFPNTPEHWRAVHQRCLAGAIEHSDGEPLVRANGRVEWIRWEVRPWRNANGDIGGLVLFSELLTEQQRIEKALRTSEARFQAVFDQAGLGIALVDPDTGNYLEVNPALARILGERQEDLVGHPWDDLCPAVASEVRDGTSRAAFDTRYRRRSGELIWCRITVTRITAPDATPCDLAVVEDITDARRASEALRESERRLAVVFEHSLAGLAVVRLRDKVILHVTDSLVRQVGWSREEMVGHTTLDLGLYVDATDRDRVFAKAPSSDKTPIEVRLRRRSGEFADFLVTVGTLELEGEPCMVVMLHDITELRRADAALLARERHLRAVFDLAPVGIAEIDLTGGRALHANARLCAIFGYDLAELTLMEDLTALTHPDDRELLRRAGAAAIASEARAPHLELRCVHRSGRPVWVNLGLAAVRDANGTPTTLLVAVEDITERRAAQVALLLRTSAMEAAANAIVIADPEGCIETFNPAFLKLTGYDAEELRGARMSLFKSGLQTGDFYEELWRTVLAGEVWHGELVNRRKDGTEYFEEMTITPVRDDQGALSHFVAIKQDVSERRRTEAALRDNEEQYRLLVDSLNDVIFTAGHDARITFVNRAISSFGHTAASLQGRSLLELIHPEDRAHCQTLLDAAGEPPPSEIRVLDAKGQVHPAWLRLRARRPGDRSAGVTGVITDLTARRTAEEQLRAAQKMEAIGRLAGGVAHDFNNLLSVILSYTELAVGDLHDGDPLRADLLEVVAAAHRAESLTRQLLAFSRKQLLKPESTDLHELLTGLAKMLRRLIGEDIDLALDTERTTGHATVDRSQMEQVIMNLVVNARDAMPDGGTVTISTADVHLDATGAHALELTPGEYVELVVRDTGSGMSDDIRAHIFEPFFTTKGMGKGTGLGLSMVYGIVRQSGGAITVESEEGAGACFRIYLPCNGVVENTLPPRAPSTHARAGHEMVLVIDDESALRSVVQRVLVNAGYRVLVAGSAGEALFAAEQHGAEVRLILTDVVMPTMSGPDLAQRLKPLCPHAAVIFMSGYTDETIERFGVLDAEFLRKPFDLRVLTERVRRALDTRGEREEAAARSSRRP
ncbi:MAG: PAS domain S-box protein [Polyangiaceae bacterium]